MAQFEIKKVETIGVIQITNLEEIKTELNHHLEKYRAIDITRSTDKELADARATLNNFVKAVESERKTVKKKQAEPYEAFALQIAELTEMAQTVIAPIDEAIRKKEEAYKFEKREEIKDIFTALGFPFEIEKIYNDRWENKTYKIDDIQKELTELKEKTDKELDFIDGHFEDLTLKVRVKNQYLETLDALNSIETIKRQYEREQQAIKTVVTSTPHVASSKESDLPSIEKNASSEPVVKVKTIKITCNLMQWNQLNIYAKSIGVKIQAID